MNWKMMDLAVKYLSVPALKEWKTTVLGMSIWMQAIVVGALVLLVGVSLLSLFWGLKMNRSARFAAGSVSVFHITLILLVSAYSMEEQKALIIAACAGAAAGFLYAFLERVFQFAAGFVFGTVLTAWLLPEYFHMKLDTQSGRIWRLVIAIAAGVLFALLAKKLRFVLTALEGGVVLGLLCDVFLPVTKIPWISEKLTGNQILNFLPLAIAALGLLIQFFQWIAMIREQRALRIPTGEEREYSSGEQTNQSGEEKAESEENTVRDEDVITMAAAEEVLVEKAKELAMAASRSAQNARLKERYEDVKEGLYTSEVAAKRLGISEEEFLEGMRKSGYLPSSEESSESSDDSSSSGTEDALQNENKSENKSEKSGSEEIAAAFSDSSADEDHFAEKGADAEDTERTDTGSAYSESADEDHFAEKSAGAEDTESADTGSAYSESADEDQTAEKGAGAGSVDDGSTDAGSTESNGAAAGSTELNGADDEGTESNSAGYKTSLSKEKNGKRKQKKH